LYWLEVSLEDSVGYLAQQQLPLTASQSGVQLDRRTQQIGFRRVDLCQPAVSDGRLFSFKINNEPVLCLGANVIPSEMDQHSITSQHSRRIIDQAIAANFNMLRMWAGGFYPTAEFYRLCDEAGILVWQDFAFACGQYPAHQAFLANVQTEAEQIVERYRAHPSLVLLAGNNEDHLLRDMKGLNSFPAESIYSDQLPEVVARVGHRSIAYIEGSPFGGAYSNDPLEGDVHQWSVWGWRQEAYQNYDRMKGRFVSEFGFLSLPSASLVSQICDLSACQPFERAITGKCPIASGFADLKRKLETRLEVARSSCYFTSWKTSCRQRTSLGE
jgi:beta-mannosidase